MNFWCWTARNPFPLAAELNSFAQKFWQIFLPILFRLLGLLKICFRINCSYSLNWTAFLIEITAEQPAISSTTKNIYQPKYSGYLLCILSDTWSIEQFFFCWSHQFQTYWDFYWNQRGKIKERNKWHSVLILRNQKFIVKKRINSRKRYVWHWNNSLYNFFKHSTKYYREYCLKWGWKISANQQTRREILQSINMSINQLCLSILHFFEKKIQ